LHGNVALHMAPLVVGTLLKERLYGRKKSIVLTSATLSVQLSPEGVDHTEQHPFTYFRHMLGLDERFEEVILDSPFNFETQSYVLLPTDILPLTAKSSMEQVSGFFAKLIQAVKGGLLGLFTAYAAIETLYLHLMDRPEVRGTKIIGQRISGGRNKVMKAYLNDPMHSVLFGTASFWEGVDIQGEALSTLVIHKLPFDVPSEPIFKARQELFSNPFMEYSVPRAILRFKQGFGRLIRSTRDYGVLVVLDNRIFQRDYGQLFLQALPSGVVVEKAKLDQIPEKVREWLSLSRS
ncbi:MAG: helicase C-terminal domain-containing protein, partial [Candidatus Peregrinibacteria bacterium]